MALPPVRAQSAGCLVRRNSTQRPRSRDRRQSEGKPLDVLFDRRGSLGQRPFTSSGVLSRDARASAALAKQSKKMSSQVSVINFDQALDVASKRAAKRCANERKLMGRWPQAMQHRNPTMCIKELVGSKSFVQSAYKRNIEEIRWAEQAMRKSGMVEVEKQARRRSSIKESFTSFGDVVQAAQLARKEGLLSDSPTEKGQESRRSSFRRGSMHDSEQESVARLLRRARSDLDLSSEFELKEILTDPDPASMYTRFKVDDILSFPVSEQERIREAFFRFKSIGSSDIEVDDLEKVLCHLGYLKIDAKEIVDITHKVTKFTTLDYDEFIRFMREYTAYERKEVQRVFREFDEDASGSLDTEEIEQVMRSFGITPFKSTVLAAIAVVDEDSTGLVEFHEFVHLLTFYMKTEGFSRAEVNELYYVFYQFATHIPGTQLRELAPEVLRNTMLALFGPQQTSLACNLVNQVMKQMEKKKKEKAAKRAQNREQGGTEEAGMKFREFLVLARRLRETEIKECKKHFDQVDWQQTGYLAAGDLLKLLRVFEYQPLRSDIEDLLERSTVEEAQVDLEKFVSLIQDFTKTDGFSRKDVAEFFETFALFDVQGLGEVDVLQVAAILRWLGFSTELAVASGYFRAVALDDGHTIDFAHFLRLMRLHREDYLQQIRDVFEQHCNDEMIIKQERLKQVLTQCDRRASVTVISNSLQGVQDTSRMDFDDLVKVIDNMRRSALLDVRKQGGFSDEETAVFRKAFEKYDLDGNRKLTRDELPPLLADMNIGMRTVDDQRHFVQLVEEARQSAVRAGATEEEAGPEGSTGITFWTFIHLLRVLQTEQDLDTARTLQSQRHAFSEKEADELKQVFRTWCEYYLAEFPIPNSSDSESEMRVDSVKAPGSDLTLSFPALEQLFLQLGIPLTGTHMNQLKSKMALDPQNALPTSEQGRLIDCSGFLRLLAWMLDCNFALIRERCEELVANHSTPEVL